MSSLEPAGGCPEPGCGCGSGIGRRELLKTVGLGAAAALAGALPAMAGPFQMSDFETLVPPDKKLSPLWLRSLTARGDRTMYQGAELETIGMPIGGLCAGQIYLGGDGRLWHWDLFNRTEGTGDSHYAHPLHPESPVDQGFALRVTAGGRTHVRALDRSGFADITFCGEYPIAYVEYQDPGLPVRVSLEAFSPFIPLDASNSSLPATILRYTVKNTGAEPIEAELAGWLENPVCLYSRVGSLRNTVHRHNEVTLLECRAEPIPEASQRSPQVFADFEGPTYGDWAAEGEAFGSGPAHGALGADQRISGNQGVGLVNSYRGSDAPQGKLTSPSFAIERPFISFLIGGGNHPGETCINLLMDGHVARTATGRNSDALEWAHWGVRDLIGQTGRIEIVDAHSGGWGHIDIDQIEFGDRPRTTPEKLEDQADYGTMALALLHSGRHDRAIAIAPEGARPAALFTDAELAGEATNPLSDGQKPCGILSRLLRLKPGEAATVTFALAWHFPNLRLDRLPGGRHYSVRFHSATDAAWYVAKHFDSLAAQTRLWHDTWYDSTLPRWFLDRTFTNTSTLATSTSHWFPNGRFYGWEGVGCCAGTCTHVWHYAHAAARLFPELERSAREMADYGVSFDPNTGLIDHRGEFHVGYAADGQAGCILRAYREHQMSADATFLRRLWPRVKKSLQYLIGQDGNGDGILEGAQHNTLDSAWYGPISWISSLYLASLKAGEEMALEMGDREFAAQTRAILDVGSKKIVDLLWNGEYFIQKPDPRHPEAMRSGNGCEIDQVFGQSWAFQVNLGRIMAEPPVKSALRSLWKYNFTPDVGPYRRVYKIGRWYAMPGEAGTIMCTFPHGGREGFGGQVGDWAAGYFNECMSGFEYQVAGHMIWEGLVTEGLAICRAIHDRYHASRRNPWNEVECGDHYARAMASYGAYLAACGYEHHGPKGHLGFAPRLSPDSFRAAFTSAEGWGTFSQTRDGGALRATIEPKWGRLRLRTLALEVAEGSRSSQVTVTLDGHAIDATHTLEGQRLLVRLAEDALIATGQRLEAAVA